MHATVRGVIGIPEVGVRVGAAILTWMPYVRGPASLTSVPKSVLTAEPVKL
jgi:hypothetical protein